LFAAAIGLLIVAAAVAIVGAALLQRSNELVVPPSPPPNTVIAPSPSQTPSPTPPVSPDPEQTNLVAVYQSAGTSADLFTLDVSTGKRTSLGTIQAQAPWAAVQWSTDRRRLTIFHVGDGAQAIAQVDVDSSEILPLVLTPSGSSDAIAPSGDRIARIEGAADVGFGLSVVDLDGNEVYHVSLPPSLVAMGGVAWAPDSRSVVIAGCQPCNLLGKGPSNVNDSHLFVIPLDGGEMRPLMTSTTGQFGFTAWSPDASSIAYTLHCESGCDAGIGIVRVADGVFTRLTRSAADNEPVWSPDGRRIAFVRTVGSGRGLWVVDADGRNASRIASASVDYGIHDPQWSPDGTSIIYSKGALSESRLTDLWLVSSTGGDEHLLLRNAVADW
jgi:Tol biopolymer transport system component